MLTSSYLLDIDSFINKSHIYTYTSIQYIYTHTHAFTQNHRLVQTIKFIQELQLLFCSVGCWYGCLFHTEWRPSPVWQIFFRNSTQYHFAWKAVMQPKFGSKWHYNDDVISHSRWKANCKWSIKVCHFHLHCLSLFLQFYLSKELFFHC